MVVFLFACVCGGGLHGLSEYQRPKSKTVNKECETFLKYISLMLFSLSFDMENVQFSVQTFFLCFC